VLVRDVQGGFNVEGHGDRLTPPPLSRVMLDKVMVEF